MLTDGLTCHIEIALDLHVIHSCDLFYLGICQSLQLDEREDKSLFGAQSLNQCFDDRHPFFVFKNTLVVGICGKLSQCLFVGQFFVL